MSDAVFATPIKCAALMAANQTRNARNQQEIIFLEIQIFLYAWPIMGQSNLGGQSARQKDAAQITQGIMARRLFSQRAKRHPRAALPSGITTQKGV